MHILTDEISSDSLIIAKDYSTNDVGSDTDTGELKIYDKRAKRGRKAGKDSTKD